MNQFLSRNSSHFSKIWIFKVFHMHYYIKDISQLINDSTLNMPQNLKKRCLEKLEVINATASESLGGPHTPG